jgi:site-specific DNA-methyltransferase (adenine-specific)
MIDGSNTVIRHNPDILTCLANLSADEVFTPPKLVEAMLDQLPQELFQNPETTFLDPFCKSGVFLREIASRLNKGLRDQMPDDQARVNHILTKQVFGLATSELTSAISRRSLYYSKKADGKYSVCTAFTTHDGNVRLPKSKHRWNANGKCQDCGATKSEYNRGASREAYAYPFIHDCDPREIFNMKFDVIVGNPPYQLSDGGFGRSASPIYHMFVEQAIKMDPRFLTMVIPARWFTGGKGLDEFRNRMLSDKNLKRLIDFENATDVFPGVDIAGGVCYFLWDRESRGECETVQMSGEQPTAITRSLNEFPVFVRQSRAVPIIKRIREIETDSGKTLDKVISGRKPFGIESNHTYGKSGVPCWFMQRIGLQHVSQNDISRGGQALVDKWKLLIPYAPIAGQTDFSKPIKFYNANNVIVASPGQVCSESWLVAYASDKEIEVLNFKSYLESKIFRFLLLQAVSSQHITRSCFCFVPDLCDYSRPVSDETLIERWSITSEEWQYIDSRIL